MEVKKSSKADLEKDKSLNFLMGLVLGFAILFVGFEYGEKDIEISLVSGITAIIEEEEIEATEQPNEPPPPAPEPEQVQIAEVINLVEDNIQTETFDFSSEDDASHAQTEVYVAPVAAVIEEEEVDENYVFVTVEKHPVFPGGEGALLKWISDNMVYPTIAAENGISGRVTCQFVVNVDGSVTDVEVVRGRDQYLDKEAIRVLKMLPKFTPGEQRGKPVRVRYSVPVNFKLQN
jgi:protein TonB